VEQATQWKSSLASSLGISVAILDTIFVLATLLLSLFSGLAAFGVEAANYVKDWKNPMFKIGCCSVMKIKMLVYKFGVNSYFKA